MSTGASTQARDTVSKAFERFESIVTPEHARSFDNTTLKDVRDAARQVEDELAARQSLKNMKRLYSFFNGIECYSKSIEVLCNGTPYLPWIWAPVKLMLQLSMDYVDALDKLIDAYRKIADSLPSLDRLSSALKDNHDFQAVLADLYGDILEFHRHAYKFVTRRSWKNFFASMWAGFDSRFKSILERMDYHRRLVNQEAFSIDLFEARSWRRRQIEEQEKMERDRRSAQLHYVMTWLRVSGDPQEENLSRVLRRCHPGSCDWILDCKETQAWLKDKSSNGVMWLHGKPGAGKSVICANMIRLMQDQGFKVFYYLCSYQDNATETYFSILRSIAAQIIQRNPDLAEYVHDKYVITRMTQTQSKSKDLLTDLLSGIPSSRLVIDGIDECEPEEQKFIIQEFSRLTSQGVTAHICKVLFSSRDIPTVSRHLRTKKSKVSELPLASEENAVRAAIRSVVDKRLLDLQDDWDEIDPDPEIVKTVKHELVEKANGMFLWVHLVLSSLEDIQRVQDLLEKVRNLPSGLQELYHRIVTRIFENKDKTTKERGHQILRWLCHARRPLKSFELLNGVSLTTETPFLTEETLLTKRALDICKPLIEVRSDGVVTFIHFSVHEFLTADYNGIIVQEIESHRDVAASCMRALCSGLDLLHPDCTEDTRLNSICTRLHDLIPYACEFWIQHLLAYTKSVGSFKCRRLIDSSSELYRKHGDISALTRMSETVVLNLDSRACLEDEGVALLAQVPVSDLIKRAMSFRIIGRELCESAEEAQAFTLRSDPTLFSKLEFVFNCAVQRLLSSNALSKIDPRKLLSFKEAYNSCGFRCRYTSCFGRFATEEERNSHERQHQRPQFCKVPSCPDSRRGFLNRRSLATHLKTYHAAKGTLPVPSGIRRSPGEGAGRAASANQPPQVLSQPPMDPNANVSLGDLGNDSNGNFDLDFGSMDSGDVLENFDSYMQSDDYGSIFDREFLGDGVKADAQKENAQGGQPISGVDENKHSQGISALEDYQRQVMLYEQQQREREQLRA